MGEKAEYRFAECGEFRSRVGGSQGKVSGFCLMLWRNHATSIELSFFGRGRGTHLSWLGNKLKLTCTSCGKEFPWSFVPQCADCKQALVDISYNLEQVKIRPEGSAMQRYFDLLPVLSPENIVDAGDGNTPCYLARELGARLGLSQLYIKVEGAHPTKSTKDRMGACGVATFRDLGIKRFVTSSTGNSCTALARVVSQFPDMHMSIFVGEEFLPRLNHVGATNVTVYVVKGGTFVEAGDAAAWYAKESGDVAERGFFFFGKREGLKTAYMEAVEQVPVPIEYYFQGISSAMGLYSTWQGAHQLKGLGMIQRVPAMVGIQEETCNPMVRAWDRGAEKIGPEDIIEFPTGLSKSTLRGNPSRVYGYIRKAVMESGGTFATAKQDAMCEMRDLVRDTEGLDICYTSAMTVVAAKNLVDIGWLKKDAVVLLNFTGSNRVGAPHPEPNYIVQREGSGWHITPGPWDSNGRDDIFERVTGVLRASAKLPAEVKLERSTKIVGGGIGLDSVGLLEFSLALEQEFGCTISETELAPQHMETVGAVVHLMREQSKSAVSGVSGS